jgi:hypothetical protein
MLCAARMRDIQIARPTDQKSVQQRSTATTALPSTFGFIQMRLGRHKQRYEWLLRGVRDEEVELRVPMFTQA